MTSLTDVDFVPMRIGKVADAQAKLAGDSPEAVLLRRALEAEQTTIQWQPSDP